MKCSRPHGANDVSQYGGMTNRCVALAGAMGDVNNNLNAGCSNDVECCALSWPMVAKYIERFAVVSACGENRAIAQSRCLGLTGTDIHIYIHTYIYTNGGRQCITITCLAFRLGNEIWGGVQIWQFGEVWK